MKVGERVSAYWCVRDFDSPRWWIIQVCNFQNQANTKGQMKSECIYEIIDFPKYHLKEIDRWKVIQTRFVMHSPE